jgi:hypothetical protein
VDQLDIALVYRFYVYVATPFSQNGFSCERNENYEQQLGPKENNIKYGDLPEFGAFEKSAVLTADFQ